MQNNKKYIFLMIFYQNSIWYTIFIGVWNHCDLSGGSNKAPWRQEFKIVLQPPRGELWKLLFG